MKKPITARQSEVLQVIKNFISANGVAPSLNELAKLLKISSTRAVVKHLVSLQKKGYIYRTSEDRGIELIEEKEGDFMAIPILGYANAGKPLTIAEEDQIGTINVAKNLLPSSNKKYFSVIIKGDSMNQKIIKGVTLNDGNYAIIDQSDTDLRKNEAFLFIIDGGATIKCVERDDNHIALYPESSNPIHSPYYIDEDTDIFVNGRVISCLKNPNFKS